MDPLKTPFSASYDNEKPSNHSLSFIPLLQLLREQVESVTLNNTGDRETQNTQFKEALASAFWT